jgi:hypothetical protein
MNLINRKMGKTQKTSIKIDRDALEKRVDELQMELGTIYNDLITDREKRNKKQRDCLIILRTSISDKSALVAALLGETKFLANVLAFHMKNNDDFEEVLSIAARKNLGEILQKLK